MDKKPTDDTEYDFGEVNTSAYSSGEPQSLKNQLLEKIKGNNRYLAIGIVIAMVVIYKLLSSLFASEPAKAPPAQAVKQQPITAPMANQPAQNEFNSKLAIIENRDNESRQQVAEALRNVARVESNMANLQAQVNLLNDRLQELSNQLKKPAKAEKKAKAVVTEAAVKKQSYYVQAIIPERAWLKKADGSTITVSKGDEIPGYGAVSIIDVPNGTVVTSSGDVISFHPSDR